MIGIVSLNDDVEKWAVPLMEQIKSYEPSVETRLQVAWPGVGGYAASMNELARYWIEHTTDEWFMPMNADVSCSGSFMAKVNSYSRDCLYCLDSNQRDNRFWVEGWFYLISRALWQDVGEFDENFKISAFEDADFTWRAADAGYGLVGITLPFKHEKDNPRRRVPGFSSTRDANFDYLVRKWNLDWRR